MSKVYFIDNKNNFLMFAGQRIVIRTLGPQDIKLKLKDFVITEEFVRVIGKNSKDHWLYDIVNFEIR